MMSRGVCSIDGCGKPHLARGWCKMHWERWKSNGDPLAVQRRPANQKCSVEGCDVHQQSGGLCAAHRMRWLKKGDVQGDIPVKKLIMDAEARFWSKVDKNGSGGCWLWTGKLASNGYAEFSHDRKRDRAHRYAYELLVGPIPEGLVIDHVWERGCRHRHCVNPAHLEPVPNGENIRRGFAPAHIAHRSNTCKRGHSLKDAWKNPKTGWRQCLTCKRERMATAS